MRKLLMLSLVLALALTGCGFFGDDDVDSDTVSIEDAESCEEVADASAAVAQDFINDAEDAGMTALAAGLNSDVAQEYMPQFEAAQAKANDLGCSEDEMRALLSDRFDDLETSGPVGEAIVNLLREQGIGS